MFNPHEKAWCCCCCGNGGGRRAVGGWVASLRWLVGWLVGVAGVARFAATMLRCHSSTQRVVTADTTLCSHYASARCEQRCNQPMIFICSCAHANQQWWWWWCVHSVARMWAWTHGECTCHPFAQTCPPSATAKEQKPPAKMLAIFVPRGKDTGCRRRPCCL